MKKYLIISLVFAVLVFSLVYSIVYIPSVSNFFVDLFPKKSDSTDQITSEPVVEIPIVLQDTIPNLSINSSDNFKTVKFGDLNLKVNFEYKVSEATERLNLKIDENNQIDGFYFPLTSEPRKDIDTSEFESDLLKNTYKLTKKSGIDDEFVKIIFETSVGSTVQDSIKGETINYKVRDIIAFSTPNMIGYYYNSDKENLYKFIIISPTKLYIFNVKNNQENYLKMKKTFYNIDIVK